MSPRPGQIVSFERFRRERERRTARVLPYLMPVEAAVRPESPFRRHELTGREVEHRQRMLRHLVAAEVEGT